MSANAFQVCADYKHDSAIEQSVAVVDIKLSIPCTGPH